MTDVIRKYSRRTELKQESRSRILDAAAKHIRTDGLEGCAIIPVMRDAGLTHGAFYSHFSDKNALAVASFSHAVAAGRARWVNHAKDASWGARLVRLAKRYLTKAHRDDLAGGCAFTALSSDAARAFPDFREAYERELRKSLAAVCEPYESADGQDERLDDEAIMLMALCIGGLSLSRAVGNEAFSLRILRVCREAVSSLADAADFRSRTQRSRSHGD